MAGRYQITVRDHTGTAVALITEWVRLEYTRNVNTPDSHVLVLPADLSIAQLLHTDEATDYQIEVRRRDLALNPVLNWTLDYEGFHLTSVHDMLESGRGRIISYGRGYDDLLMRRSILYPSGSTGSAKIGPGETVMKEYVDENAGPGATSPSRLLASGVTPGLTIQEDLAAGVVWEGARAYRSLFDVVQEIAHAALVDFKIVGNGAAAFEFRAKAYPWGTDRSTQGLEPLTGLNGAGNSPVIFSETFGNMLRSSHVYAHTDEANVVIVLGQGLEDQRAILQRQNGDAQALTPWNRREVTRNANQESTVAGLQAVGDAVLHDLKARETFNFSVMQAGPWFYLRDYNLGDLVTAYHDTQRHFQITSVTVIVESGRETIRLEVQEDD